MNIERLMVWMEPTVDATFVAPPLDPAVAREVLSAAGRSEADHRRLLERWNGFYALDGLLHVFGACTSPPNHSLREWNRPEGWRSAWGRLTEGLTFFAEDAFGDQFAYRAGKVVRFRALQGGIEPMQATLVEWIEAVLLEPDYVLHKRLFDECVARHGPLPHGGHFAPIGSPVAGRGIDPARVQVVPTRDSMEIKAISGHLVRRTSSLRIPKA